jgi:hypothetical protein
MLAERWNCSNRCFGIIESGVYLAELTELDGNSELVIFSLQLNSIALKESEELISDSNDIFKI